MVCFGFGSTNHITRFYIDSFGYFPNWLRYSLQDRLRRRLHRPEFHHPLSQSHSHSFRREGICHLAQMKVAKKTALRLRVTVVKRSIVIGSCNLQLATLYQECVSLGIRIKITRIMEHQPLWSRIHRFLWCTMIRVILEHWSKERNAP